LTKIYFYKSQTFFIAGMGVSIFSYSNDVKVGVMTDKVLMTNPGALVDLFEENVYKLAKELDIDCREE